MVSSSAMTDVVPAVAAGVLGTMYADARTHFSKDFRVVLDGLKVLIK